MQEAQRTLLTKLRLALLDGGNNHVAGRRGRETVKTSTDAADGNNEQVLGASVVGAVHDGAHGQTERHAVLSSLRTLGHSEWFWVEKQARSAGRLTSSDDG